MDADPAASPPATQPPLADADSPWIPTRRPILRFAGLLALIMVPFTAFFYGVLTKTAIFERYLHLNAEVSARLLRLFGEDAKASGPTLSSPACSLEIRHGCDAILPTALFMAAILAFPVKMRTKWTALVLGSAALLVINLVRIITLYYTRVHRPSWFHSMHVDVWQPAFIFLALLFWIIWALRATRPPVQRMA